MRVPLRLWFVSSLLAAVAVADDFDQTVAPLLARRCVECHNPSDKKGGLDLTSAAGVAKGGDGGAVIVAGKPDDSPLWQRVVAGEMPPKKKLPASERETLRNWVAAGAKWGRTIDPFQFTTERRAGYDWWSFQPVKRPALPAVKDRPWPRNAIDFHVLARLEERSLAPSPEADRATLIRRLSFDLLGLPPSPAAITEFLADESPDAAERLVDRLLASPHYGERWARHWLDVAHFGESDGFEYDKLRPNAWHYRDWVIRALNRDLPFDRFARLQIAGDVLEPDDRDALIATGFLVGGAHDYLMPAGELMRQIMRQDELEDLVATVSQTFLGLSAQCARCHEHKFDPIPQTDYYRLSSALAGVKRGDRAIPAATASQPLERQIADWTRELAAIDEAARRKVLERRKGTGDSPPKRPVPPQPLAAWEFDNSFDDKIGGVKGEAFGGAKLDNGRLVVDGKGAYVASAPLKTDLAAKTLEAVVTLAHLSQRGGGVISVQTLDGATFDAIVFGEREPGQWMAGSNFFQRTESFNGPVETQADKRPVHVAMVYAADGTITCYVNGQPYGRAYQKKLQPFSAGKSQVVFGLRHGPVGGSKMLAGAIHRAAVYDRALAPDEVAVAAGVESDFVSETEIVAELAARERERRGTLQTQIAAAQEQLRRQQADKAFAVTPQAAPVTHVLARGNPAQPQAAVAPGGLASLVGLPSEFGLSPDAPEAQRRRELARWVTDPRNPLFRRAIVNRLWHYHFGVGLVPTPNDLGFSGGQPSHPELLDWLADELGGGEFSLKRVQRLIVTSATYRQASAPNPTALQIDADNRWLWRKSPRRLEAEAVRDAMLAAAGELNAEMGGPGYQDFRPFLRGGTQFYEPLDPVGPLFQRRSVYRTWARGGHNLMLDTFDCPDPSTLTPRRSVTTTPLQALSLLNNSFVLRMSDRFADRLRREAGDDTGRQIELAFLLTRGRPPTPAELELARPFVVANGLPEFCRVAFNMNAFLYVP